MRDIVFYDSETFPIQPALQAPPVVCGQFAYTPGQPEIYLRGEALQRLENILRRGTLAGHFVSYDMLAAGATAPELLPLIFEAYRDDRIICTQMRERLIHIAKGLDERPVGLLPSLERYGIKHGFTEDDKTGSDSWRTRYGELEGVPVHEWPEDARRYALEDVRHGHKLMDRQDGAKEPLQDQFRQARGALVLGLTSAHGMRADQEYVGHYGRRLRDEFLEVQSRLALAGLLERKPDWTWKKSQNAARELMEKTCAEVDAPVPLTDKGNVSLQAKKIDEIAAMIQEESDDPHPLVDYARYTTLTTLRGRTRRISLAGDLPIQTRFDSLKATGRTSSSMPKAKEGESVSAWGDQTQNMPRVEGLRECYKARDGYNLLSVDWSAVELSTLAEVCHNFFGFSHLGDTIRAGKCPHLDFAVYREGWDYDWAKSAQSGFHGEETKKVVKYERQKSKPFNFGIPGGLGVDTFRQWSALQYNQHFTKQEVKRLKAAWLRKYPEIKKYFKVARNIVGGDGSLMHIYSGRKRGGLIFTNACNTPFQGLAADMAKDAGFELAFECYVDTSSILYGCRIVNFIHDEFLLEVPEWKAHECALRVVAIMEAAGRKWAPSAPPAAEPALSRRWRKAADPVYRDGRLIPYEDRPYTDKERAKVIKLRERGKSEYDIALATAREMGKLAA